MLLSWEQRLVDSFRKQSITQQAATLAQAIANPLASGPLIIAYREVMTSAEKASFLAD